MSRTSTDDRSDSMNPNNDAYSASEENHRNQVNGNDDDDDGDTVLLRERNVHMAIKHNLTNFYHRESMVDEKCLPESVEEETSTLSISPKMLSNIFISLIDKDMKERNEKVSAFSIDAAIEDLQKIWLTGKFLFVCLYDKERILFEKSNLPNLSNGDISLLLQMEKILGFLKRAESGLNFARSKLMSLDPEYLREGCEELRQLGVWGAAVEVLNKDRLEMVVRLEAKSLKTESDSIRSNILLSKHSALAQKKRGWIKRFHAGGVEHSPEFLTFMKPAKLSELAI